jgi:hypothetical protein
MTTQNTLFQAETLHLTVIVRLVIAIKLTGQFRPYIYLMQLKVQPGIELLELRVYKITILLHDYEKKVFFFNTGARNML